MDAAIVSPARSELVAAVLGVDRGLLARAHVKQ